MARRTRTAFTAPIEGAPITWKEAPRSIADLGFDESRSLAEILSDEAARKLPIVTSFMNEQFGWKISH
jgi:hypothetical protein